MFKCVDMANHHIKETIKLKTAFFKLKYNSLINQNKANNKHIAGL
jgi:hypothetical protein